MIVGIGLRTYFSIQHLQAAAYFAKQSKELEAGSVHHASELTGSHVRKAYVTGSLLSSIAFMEALINELYADAATSDGAHLESLGEKDRALIAQLGETPTVERAPILSKFDILLRAAGREPIKRDSSPGQDAALAIQLRNELAHTKAEFFDWGTSDFVRAGNFYESKLAKGIAGRFPSGIGSTGESDAWIGSGCAEWALRSTLSYVDKVFQDLGIKPIYDHVRRDLAV